MPERTYLNSGEAGPEWSRLSMDIANPDTPQDGCVYLSIEGEDSIVLDAAQTLDLARQLTAIASRAGTKTGIIVGHDFVNEKVAA